MNARGYITALLPDTQSVVKIAPALVDQGVMCDEICIGALPHEALESLCARTGAVPMEPPIAQQLSEVGLSDERARYCEEQVNGGAVLLLLPAALHADECLEVLRGAGADAVAEQADDTIRVPLRAEQLRITKRTVRDADVRVRKVVALVTQKIDVPLKREELVITRKPPNGEPESIRVPLSHEEVDVRKRVVVLNEASVRRETTEFIEHIEEPVRRERLQVHHVPNQGRTENVNNMHDTRNEISAFFADRASAEAAAEELRTNGVPDEDVVVQGPGGSGFLDGVKRFFSGEALDAPDDGAILRVYGADDETVTPVIESHDGRISDEAPYEAESGTMKLHEERLNITKHPEKQGEVRLTKEVETTEKNVDVPVKREEVILTRRRVDEPDDTAEIGDDEEIRIPVLRDELSVEKERVTTEEVGVEKRAVEQTQHVSASLQKERARLETDGRVGTTLDDRE